eukprot:gene725-719_t
MKIETLAVHAGYSPDPTTKAVAVPIYQTVAYAFDSAQHGADLFDLKVPGNIYTRIMNPTTDVLEKRVAALEGGIAALAVASGMAAITYAIQTIAEAGDNIVSASTLYGGTYNLFAHTLPQQGITTRFADPRDPASFAQHIDARTKAIFIDYHGVVYTEALGPAAFIGRARVVPLRNTGAALSPQSAFLILQGIETLALRMDRICDNTLALAKYLQSHPKVEWVRYAGLPDHPDHAVVQRQSGGKASGILSFSVKNSDADPRAAGARFLDALQLFTRLVNIGDAKSLATHPASTTHRQLNPEELAKAGVSEGMVRLSVGIEHIDDLQADLAQALDKV